MFSVYHFLSSHNVKVVILATIDLAIDLIELATVRG